MPQDPTHTNGDGTGGGQDNGSVILPDCVAELRQWEKEGKDARKLSALAAACAELQKAASTAAEKKAQGRAKSADEVKKAKKDLNDATAAWKAAVKLVGEDDNTDGTLDKTLERKTKEKSDIEDGLKKLDKKLEPLFEALLSAELKEKEAIAAREKAQKEHAAASKPVDVESKKVEALTKEIDGLNKDIEKAKADRAKAKASQVAEEESPRKEARESACAAAKARLTAIEAEVDADKRAALADYLRTKKDIEDGEA